MHCAKVKSSRNKKLNTRSPTRLPSRAMASSEGQPPKRSRMNKLQLEQEISHNFFTPTIPNFLPQPSQSTPPNVLHNKPPVVQVTSPQQQEKNQPQEPLEPQQQKQQPQQQKQQPQQKQQKQPKQQKKLPTTSPQSNHPETPRSHTDSLALESPQQQKQSNGPSTSRQKATPPTPPIQKQPQSTKIVDVPPLNTAMTPALSQRYSHDISFPERSDLPRRKHVDLDQNHSHHLGHFVQAGMGISSQYAAHQEATRDGVLVDIVKRKQLTQVSDTDTVPLELTRKEFLRRPGLVVDADLASVLQPIVSTQDLAVLSLSRPKLTSKREIDLTRGSSFSEHIRHLFPVDDFSGGVPPFTDIELRAMFNRRPRFLNFVTYNNPHGFDITVLHRLAAQQNPERRAFMVRQQITHRYWHLQGEGAKQQNQPKISYRMHVHRTLNPRSNTFKHFHLKPRDQKTKQQKMEERQARRNADLEDDENNGHLNDDQRSETRVTRHSDLSNPNDYTLDIDEWLFSHVVGTQHDIYLKLKQSGLTEEQISQTRKLASATSDELLALVEADPASMDPSIRRALEIRRKALTKEDLSKRRSRLGDVFTGFVKNIDNPGRFAKAVLATEQAQGASLVDSKLRKELEEEVARNGGLNLKKADVEGLLRSGMYIHSRKKQLETLALKGAIKRRSESVDEDDLLM